MSESKKQTKEADKKVKEKKRSKSRKKMSKETLFGVAVVVGLAAWDVSLPLNRYLTLNGTYVEVNDEKITRVEYDYNYYQAKANYLNQYGQMLQMYSGIDITSDFSDEMYSETMTWGDFFDETTVDSLKRIKGLQAEAKKAGFVYDPTEEYNTLFENIEEATKEAGISVDEYLQAYYGPYATKERIEGFMKDSMVSSAYYNDVLKQKTPSDEEITNYYNENKDDYDVVDYYLTTIDAELPTEPTDLADEGAVPGDDENPYSPSEAEIEKAMSDAKKLAEEAKSTVKTSDNLVEGMKQSGMVYLIRDWMFEDGRKNGDATVVEDSTYHRYYVVSFVKRYRDETPTADVRVIIVENEEADSVFDEWKNGENTEDRFIELCNKYSENTGLEGGLIEKIAASDIEDEMGDWIFAKNRKAGDSEKISMDGEHTYILYYKGENKPQWNTSISESLTSEAMNAYLDEVKANVEVKDPKNNLAYIKIREKEAADAKAAEEAAAAEAAQESEADASEDSAEE